MPGMYEGEVSLCNAELHGHASMTFPRSIDLLAQRARRTHLLSLGRWRQGAARFAGRDRFGDPFNTTSRSAVNALRGNPRAHMNLPVIAGTVSTGIFVLSMLPMLQKACKTKDLRSYSLGSLWLSNGGNLVHSVYVYSLAPGPIWFLHSFYLVVTALMLIWNVCYERRIHIFMVVKRHVLALARSINQLRGHAGTSGVASPRPPERA